MINEDVKKTIEDLLEGIDEFDSKYMTYKSKTHREFLKKTLNYIKRKEQECEELRKQLDRYLNQEEEDIRQLNNDNKLDDILSAIKKANDQIEKESKYKQTLDEIEQTISNFPSKGISEILQTQMEYTQSLLSVSEAKLQKILDIINKAKEW